jgi:hypothetical protein
VAEKEEGLHGHTKNPTSLIAGEVGAGILSCRHIRRLNLGFNIGEKEVKLGFRCLRTPARVGTRGGMR